MGEYTKRLNLITQVQRSLSSSPSDPFACTCIYSTNYINVSKAQVKKKNYNCLYLNYWCFTTALCIAFTQMISYYTPPYPSLTLSGMPPSHTGITLVLRPALMNSMHKVPHQPIHYMRAFQNKTLINSAVCTNAAAPIN